LQIDFIRIPPRTQRSFTVQILVLFSVVDKTPGRFLSANRSNCRQRGLFGAGGPDDGPGRGPEPGPPGLGLLGPGLLGPGLLGPGLLGPIPPGPAPGGGGRMSDPSSFLNHSVC
jgi:hypothetical protein